MNCHFFRILSKCHNLVELNLGWTGLSEKSLQSICSLLKDQLKRLCLSGNRETLTDEHMELLLLNCPNLKEIDVSDSSKLTSVSLNLILEHCHSIESISTSRCYSIQPSSYLMLASWLVVFIYWTKKQLYQTQTCTFTFQKYSDLLAHTLLRSNV